MRRSVEHLFDIRYFFRKQLLSFVRAVTLALPIALTCRGRTVRSPNIGVQNFSIFYGSSETKPASLSVFLIVEAEFDK
jgi:hypothetical protein